MDLLAPIKEKHIGSKCTLFGKAARISGRKLNFAIVSQLDGNCSIEYSWPCVSRVMNNGGNFS